MPSQTEIRDQVPRRIVTALESNCPGGVRGGHRATSPPDTATRRPDAPIFLGGLAMLLWCRRPDCVIAGFGRKTSTSPDDTERGLA